MSRLIAILAGLLLIVIAVVIVVPMLIPMETYKAKVVELVKAQTGRDLRIDGDIGLSFFPNIAIAIGDVGLSNPEWARDSEMASMKEMISKCSTCTSLHRAIGARLSPRPIVFSPSSAKSGSRSQGRVLMLLRTAPNC